MKKIFIIILFIFSLYLGIKIYKEEQIKNFVASITEADRHRVYIGEEDQWKNELIKKTLPPKPPKTKNTEALSMNYVDTKKYNIETEKAIQIIENLNLRTPKEISEWLTTKIKYKEEHRSDRENQNDGGDGSNSSTGFSSTSNV